MAEKKGESRKEPRMNGREEDSREMYNQRRSWGYMSRLEGGDTAAIVDRCFRGAFRGGKNRRRWREGGSMDQTSEGVHESEINGKLVD